MAKDELSSIIAKKLNKGLKMLKNKLNIMTEKKARKGRPQMYVEPADKMYRKRVPARLHSEVEKVVVSFLKPYLKPSKNNVNRQN